MCWLACWKHCEIGNGWHTWALRNRRAEISAKVTPPTKTTSTRARLPSGTLKYVKGQKDKVCQESYKTTDFCKF